MNGDHFPSWMTEAGAATLARGYYCPGESTPRDVYRRLSSTAAQILDRPDLEARFFDAFWNGWIGCASPVLANFGHSRGLPISCFGIHPGDSVDSIFSKAHEQAMMSKSGGGVGVGLSDVRGRGASIKFNGHSEGIVPWAKVYDSTVAAVSQGCYDRDTELLTESGWCRFVDLVKGERVAQVNDEGYVEWVTPQRYIQLSVDEELYHVTTTVGSVDLLVTGNHDMVIRRRRRVSNKRGADGRFISSERVVGELESVRADSVKYHRDVVHVMAAASSVEGESLTPFERVLIAFQADGTEAPSGNSTGEILHAFRFKKERKIQRLRTLLQEASLSFSESEHASGATSFLVRFPEESPPKHFRDWVKLSDFSQAKAAAFMDELRQWDGSSRTLSSHGFMSTHEDDVDLAHSLAILAGYQARKSKRVRSVPRKPLYSVFWVEGHSTVGGEAISVRTVPYRGKVYCVEVESHRLVVRRNGAVAVCGNSTRRGASSVNLSVNHPDIDEFLDIRRPQGDPNRQCLNLHHCVVVDDLFMHKVQDGDLDARTLWLKILKTRLETGEPYIMFEDAMNADRPAYYVETGKRVSMTNICCLAGETLVTTHEGPRRIRDLVGKTVTIWDGESWVSCSNFEQRGFDRLYAIHLADGTIIQANGKHRWFAAQGYNAVRRDQYREVLTSELQEGMFLQSHETETHGSEKLNGAYALGFLLGDGTCHKQVPYLNLHFPKYPCADAFVESLAEIPVLEKRRADCIQEPSFSDEVVEANAWGRQQFRRSRGLTARAGTVLPFVSIYRHGLPLEIWSGWSAVSKLAFVGGLLDADGTWAGNNIQLAAKSRQLMLDIKQLLDSCAIRSALSESGKVWRLNIYASGVSRLMPYLKRLHRADFSYDRDQTGWRRVTCIECLSEVAPVYCPQIPTTTKFALACGLMNGNTEISLYTDPRHSFVCCLSSLNLAKYDEWVGTDIVSLGIHFLDAVMQDFIVRASDIPGMEPAIRGAVAGRPLGLGVMGWHTLLQQRALPFDSFGAMQLNATVFKQIAEQADTASRVLASRYGEPEWCQGTGRRNTHLTAIAPTISNSLICGEVSAGIEPRRANAYTFKTAKGTFFLKNELLRPYLAAADLDTSDVWQDIAIRGGSVQHLNLPAAVKSVFLTAPEINQRAVVRQASQRQRWVEQAQSINLFFTSSPDPKWFNQVHLAAWELGVKTLYYVRADSVLQADVASRAMSDDCSACEG